MKVIVCGSRKLPETRDNVRIAVRLLREAKATEVFSGCCHGGDAVGEMAAAVLGLPVRLFEANWRKLGKAAGPIRNAQMAMEADICIAFPGGAGTASMLVEAKENGLRIVHATPASEAYRWLDKHSGHGSEV